MKKIQFWGFIALAGIAILASCTNSFDPPNAEQSPLADGMGRVVIRIAGTEARTFLPDVNELASMALEYKLIITKDGDDTPSVDATLSGNNWIGDLTAGNYSVAITALKSDMSQTVAEGNKTFTVDKNSSSSVSVTLTTTQQGSGVFSYAVNVSDDVTITGGSIQIVSRSGSLIDSINLADDGMNGDMILQSGDYRILLELTGIVGTQERIYRTTAVVYIADEITTQAVYELTEDDFFYNVFSVYFDSAGGSAVFPQTIISGGTASRPDDPTRSGYAFYDWYIDSALTVVYNFSTPVISDVTLYARWINTNMVVTNTIEWNNALYLIRTGSNSNNQTYTITVNGNVSISGSTVNTFGTVTGISVTLQGSGKLYLTSTGNIIRLTANQTLIIDSADLTLQGLKSGQNSATQNNNTSAIYVDGSTAQLKLRNGAITGNIASSSSSSYGSGVYVSNGTFTMSGGTITGNTASYTGSTASASGGGGVYVNNGTFTMNGGEISGNTASSHNLGGGGGVFVGGSGTFTMSGGKISNNTATGDSPFGGGVCMRGGTFTMSGGEISGNTATSSNPRGGGVFIYNAIFIMSGGEISGNSTYSSTTPPTGGGGGVYVNVGTFRIVTGTVYGSNASPTTLRNTVNNNNNEGAALYGTAQRGTFSGETWNSMGDLSTTNNTIRVVNGVLQ